MVEHSKLWEGGERQTRGKSLAAPFWSWSCSVKKEKRKKKNSQATLEAHLQVRKRRRRGKKTHLYIFFFFRLRRFFLKSRIRGEFTQREVSNLLKARTHRSQIHFLFLSEHCCARLSAFKVEKATQSLWSSGGFIFQNDGISYKFRCRGEVHQLREQFMKLAKKASIRDSPLQKKKKEKRNSVNAPLSVLRSARLWFNLWKKRRLLETPGWQT